MKRWLLTMLLLLTGLGLNARATEEAAAIGIGGNAPLQVGVQAQVLISHASYPHLEAFEVKATYGAGGFTPVSEQLGHPNDNGILSWTPAKAGDVLIEAKAPAAEGAPAVALSQNFNISGDAAPFPRWYHLLGIVLGIVLGLMMRPLLHRRMAEKGRKA